LDDHLLEAAKRRARERGETLGQVVEGALRRELAEPVAHEPVEVPVFHGGGGPLPGVDLRSNSALRELLDSDSPMTKLR
jgi:hypothetical protein